MTVSLEGAIDQGFFTDLDSLFDTRLASLELLDPRIAIAALEGNYRERLEDSFPFVDKEMFKKLYATRDKEVLAKAVPTHVISMITDFVEGATGELAPLTKSVTIYVNVYPYKLSLKEASALIEPLEKATQGRADIQIVNYRPEKLTPQMCREKLSILMMYEYGDWLECHSENGNFKTCQIPDVQLCVPELYFNRVPSSEQLAEMSKRNLSPFRAQEQGAAGIIKLVMYPIRVFCANMPDKVVENIKARL